MWKAALVFMISLAAGFLIAKSGKPETKEADVRESGSRSAKVSRKDRWRAEDFRAALKVERETRWEPLFAEELKDWTTADLKAAVNEGLSMPERVLPYGRANELMNALVCEWARRDLDDTLQWFEKLPTDGMRNQFGHCLAAAWPKERAEEGLEFVFAHPGMFDLKRTTSAAPIVQLAIEKAAEKGALAVAELLGRVTEHQLNPRYAEGWKFPENFDFAKLAASPQAAELEQGHAFFAGVWMSRDREQAFRQLLGDDKVSMKDLFADLMPQNGGIDHKAAADRAKWLAGRLEQLDEQRSMVLVTQAVDAFIDSPDTLSAFTVSLNDDDQRRAFSAKVVNSLAQKSVQSAMDYLETTESPERRLASLETAQTDSYRRWWPNEAWEQAVREKLTSWNASPERVDAIVKHLKNPNR